MHEGVLAAGTSCPRWGRLTLVEVKSSMSAKDQFPRIVWTTSQGAGNERTGEWLPPTTDH